jgi:ferredoxin
VSETISQAALRRLVDEWIGQGRRVAGPVLVKPDLLSYACVRGGDSLVLEGFVHPANSMKEFVFPRHEELFSYRVLGKRVEIADDDTAFGAQIVVAARPCDAAALPILDHVFNWDYADEFYNRRRRATTVVTLACSTHDEACFCTSVGLGPDASRGSDAMLFDLGDGEYEVRQVTDKGRDVFAGRTTPSDRIAAVPPGPEKRFETERIRRYVGEQFEGAIWAKTSLACLGCGACTYSCPTCHCFDMVDEGNLNGGARVKNWDSCQFAMFTLHASGHNPRPSQAQRQRQRVYHKFRVYPDKFGEVLCTGCGSCLRNCAAGLGVLNVLEAIERDDAEHLQA